MNSLPYFKPKHTAFQVFMLTTSRYPLQVLLGIHDPNSGSRRWDSGTGDAIQANNEQLTHFIDPSNL